MAKTDGILNLCPFFDPIAFDNDNNSAPQVINCILNIPTSIAAILGNLLVLISIWRTPSLHLASNALLFGLALSDLGVGLVVQPLFVAFSIAKINGRVDVFCTSGTLLLVTGYCLCGISLLTLTAISLDRFIALHLHLRYKGLVTITRVVWLLVGIWFFSAIWSMLPLLKVPINILLLCSLIVACLCICFMVFSYLNIYRVVHRHQTQIQAQIELHAQQQGGQNSLNMVQYKKSCFAMFLVCFLFFLCYLPYVLVIAWITRTGHNVALQIAYEFSSTILFSGSCLNPLVYCWRLREFRVAFRETVRKYCFKCGTDS